MAELKNAVPEIWKLPKWKNKPSSRMSTHRDSHIEQKITRKCKQVLSPSVSNGPGNEARSVSTQQYMYFLLSNCLSIYLGWLTHTQYVHVHVH